MKLVQQLGRLGLFGNVVRAGGDVILRRPDGAVIQASAVMVAACVVAGAVVHGGRILWALAAGIAVLGGYLLSDRLRTGLYVSGGVIYWAANGKQQVVCQSDRVVRLALLRVGEVWDDDQEIQFQDGTGTAVATLANKRQSPSSRVGRWSRRDLESFAKAAGWQFEVDLSGSRLTRPNNTGRTI
jgi:hypothetical protein